MKVLIVDSTTEGQAFVASKIQEFSAADIELLDLRIKLANPSDFLERVIGADVLFVGPGIEGIATSIARSALAANPHLHVIMLVSDQSYSGGTFRTAHLVGVHKVFPTSVKALDLLQELIAVHATFKREGRAIDGQVIAVAHIKGGVGATSIAAALGEACSSYGRKTLLWDLDVESRDLSRGLMVSGVQSSVVSAWINNTLEITRQSFKDALFAISAEASVLMPPDKFREGMDLACHCDGALIAQRILDLARVTHDVVIVDTAGRMGPAIGTVLRAADKVVVVLDDSALGLTAVDFFLSSLREIIGNLDRVQFICSGTQQSASEIALELTTAHKLPSSAWRLPAMPFDAVGGSWPGQGKTLFSLGARSTQLAISEMAATLGLIQYKETEQHVSSLKPGAIPASSRHAAAEQERGLFGRVYQRLFEQ